MMQRRARCWILIEKYVTASFASYEQTKFSLPCHHHLLLRATALSLPPSFAYISRARSDRRESLSNDRAKRGCKVE